MLWFFTFTFCPSIVDFSFVVTMRLTEVIL
jgi:hypothetical protein